MGGEQESLLLEGLEVEHRGNQGENTQPGIRLQLKENVCTQEAVHRTEQIR